MKQTRCLLGLLIFLGLIDPNPIPALANPTDLTNSRVKTVQDNGPASQKFDIVFLGDGFSARDQASYDAKVRSCLSILWNVSPFRELRNHFNVHVISVDADSGSGFDAKGKRQADYPFGSTYTKDGSDVVVLSKQGLALQTAKLAPGVDALIVITTLPGRSHAGSMVLLADDQSALPHELGHLIGHLGDEYSSGSKLVDRDNHQLPAGDLPYRNIQVASTIDPTSSASLKRTAKWGHFIDLPDSDPIVSAYQGGYYREVDVWRPSYSCVMRSSSGAIFCPVCHEEIYKAILLKGGGGFNDKTYHAQFPLKLWRTKMY